MSAWQIERVDDRIAFAGDLHISDASAIWQRLREASTPATEALTFDLAGATSIDGAAMALIVEQRAQLVARGVHCEIIGGNAQLRELVRLFHGDRAVTRRLKPARRGTLTQLGANTERALRRSYSLISFAGELVASLRYPRVADLRALPSLIARAGADGVPIVLVLNFLVGFVMAYQSTQQLRMYGANIYVADIVGISVTRELAPLMTAIIMAGRSGAAYAAELGTMRVSEEVDALRTLGFVPMSYLVVPRIAALAIAAPVLTLIGDVVGVGGGIFVGAYSLDITPAGFLAELRTVLLPSDVWTGVIKSVAFGIAIAFIGCQQGLTASGAASGVGRSTTSTVVQCLFTIVVVDTLFTMMFRGVGA